MMKGMIFILITFLILLSPLKSEEDIDRLATRVYNAYLNNKPLPVFSTMRPELTALTAYEVQASYVKKRLSRDEITGFKAGLTNEKSQNRFRVTMPVSGVLFASGIRDANNRIDRQRSNQLMIETEIGFVVGKRINKPVSNISKLKKRIRSVVAAIELPDLEFEDMSELKGVDIISGNVSAYAYILGEAQKRKRINLSKVSLILSREGEIINSGSGSDLLGDPWEAALWLVNNTVSQGWSIQPGHILLAGAIGKMLPAKPGNYVADFDELGRISFIINE
jgi:2-keto-4-pentenoate hydratase